MADISRMQKLPRAQQKTLLDEVAKSQRAIYTITLNANGTYTAASSMDKKPGDADSGTWVQVGNSVKLTSTKKDAEKAGTVTFKMAPSGKTMSMDLPPMQGITGKLVMSR